MKFGILYRSEVSSFWKHYIFINNTSMVIFDESFLKTEYRDDLNMDLIEEENLKKVNVSKLGKVAKRAIIEGILC